MKQGKFERKNCARKMANPFSLKQQPFPIATGPCTIGTKLQPNLFCEPSKIGREKWENHAYFKEKSSWSTSATSSCTGPLTLAWTEKQKKSLVCQWTCYFSSANHHSFIFQCLILHVYWSVNNTRNFCVHLYNFSFLNIYVHDKRNKGGEEKEQDLGASVQETVWTV